MSAAWTSVFYGFASLCLGLVATCVLPLSLPSLLSTSLGFSISAEQLGRLELALLVATVVLSALFIVNGVLAAIIDRGHRQADDR